MQLRINTPAIAADVRAIDELIRELQRQREETLAPARSEPEQVRAYLQAEVAAACEAARGALIEEAQDRLRNARRVAMVLGVVEPALAIRITEAGEVQRAAPPGAKPRGGHGRKA